MLVYRMLLIIHSKKVSCFCGILCNRESFLADFCTWILWKPVKAGNCEMFLEDEGKERCGTAKFFTTNNK